MNDRGGAKTWVVLLLGVIALMLVLGCHVVSYAKITGGRKLCILTKDHIGFRSTIVTAPNELMFGLQNPMLAARLVSGSGTCVDF